MTAWKDIPSGERPWAVYTIVRQLQPLAYGAAIQRAIESEHGKYVSAGWLYAVLDRLEREGFLRRENKPHPDPFIHAARGFKAAAFYYPTSKLRQHSEALGWEPDSGLAGALARTVHTG